MTELSRTKCVYAIYDIEMKMWTEPVVLRNDIEAKRLFKSMIKKDYFNGCKVEFYKLGLYKIDSEVVYNPFRYFDKLTIPQILRIDDTVEDEEEVKENE